MVRHSKGSLLVLVAALAIGLVAARAEAQNGPYDWADDVFSCYKSKQNKVMPKFPKRTQAAMADRFGSSSQDVKKRRTLCLPAEKDGASAADAATLLMGLKIKTGKGQPKHIAQSNLRVFNALGDIRFDTKKEALLLTPAAFGAEGPVFDDHAVDNYKCYKGKVTKGTPKFAKGVKAQLGDALEDDRAFDVKRPKMLCAASSKNGHAIKTAEAAMLCYKIKASKGERKATPQTMLETTDGFGLTRMDTKKESLVCIPSLISPPDAFCGDGVNNQSAEECDGSGDTCFGGSGLCGSDCTCTTCGNGQLDDGETCDVGVGCDFEAATCDACGACTPRPSLGQRELSLSGDSGFFTSFIPGNAIGAPTGTLTLAAGIVSPTTGTAPVSLAGDGPQTLTIDVTLGGITLCYRYESCSGELYCSGGQNVDLLLEIDSLGADAGQCLRDGSGRCPDAAGNVCCSNSCEGVAVGSGNSETATIPAGSGDSGDGAMALTCNVTISQEALNADCDEADFSDDVTQQQVLTTGSTSVRVLNHCAGSTTGNGPDTVPEFTKTGENFSCSDWASEDSAGQLTWGIATEEPSGIILGDGSQVVIYAD